jgi:hypothetical protein
MEDGENLDVDMCQIAAGPYPGYANAVNKLISTLLGTDPDLPKLNEEDELKLLCGTADAEWFIIGGDDVFPDPDHSAEEIAAQCRDYFSERNLPTGDHGWEDSTYGVMQPTGDRWGEDPTNPNPRVRSAYIDRVCGSAWIGREFARRVNQGRGPLYPEYFHMYVDEELQAVATKLGVLWQRPDLTQIHQHWGRPKPGHATGHRKDMPAFLEKANDPKVWDEAKAIFEKRKREGFPGSEPL